jgi:hypothetical protein
MDTLAEKIRCPFEFQIKLVRYNALRVMNEKFFDVSKTTHINENVSKRSSTPHPPYPLHRDPSILLYR